MSYTNIIVDHMKLEYKGLFKASDMFKLVDSWLFERGMEKRVNKNYELETSDGKFLEWEVASWKKVTDYIRIIISPRFLIYGLKKTDIAVDSEIKQLDHGRVIVYFDSYIEYDYDHRWDGHPFFVFLRTLYDKFIFSTYTHRFEERLAMDTHQLYDTMEKFFNMYRKYKVVSRPALFR